MHDDANVCVCVCVCARVSGSTPVKLMLVFECLCFSVYICACEHHCMRLPRFLYQYETRYDVV